jgi:hypothetical protein
MHPAASGSSNFPWQSHAVESGCVSFHNLSDFDELGEAAYNGVLVFEKRET